MNELITAHLDNVIKFVAFHCDPVVAMVPLKTHFDVSDVLCCTVTYLKICDETKWKSGNPVVH
jgi:hypothetical protein